MNNKYVRAYFIASGVLFNILLGSCAMITLVTAVLMPAAPVAMSTNTAAPTVTAKPSNTPAPTATGIPTNTPRPASTRTPRVEQCAIQFMDTEYYFSAYAIFTGPHAQELCDAVVMQPPQEGLRVEQATTWPTDPEWCAFENGSDTVSIVSDTDFVGKAVCDGMRDGLDTSLRG